tara:strand:+ start:8835 stop:9326 length:492 start_codon:yes stop_codon:yes gene_type:complete
VWFFIVLIFGDRKYRASSLCIFLCVAVNIAWIKISVEQGLAGSFTERKEFLIDLEGATALTIAMLLKYDKTAWMHALLLAFATLCHIMIILSIINSHAGFFYIWYDELIIMVGLLQMAVSYNGLRGATVNAYGLIQDLLSWLGLYNSGTGEGLHLQKEAKRKI